MESEEEEEYSSFSNQIQSNVENILNLNNESKEKSISNEKARSLPTESFGHFKGPRLFRRSPLSFQIR